MISTEWLTAGRRLKVLVGHYGSGKTELAVNMALRLAQTARTMLIDLDIVNPFFRSAEVKPLLQENGVEVVYPAYALSGVDIPILPAEVERAFTTDGYCVFDVGGDDDGAVALGRYHAQFSACPADVYFVVNPFRPRTARVGQALALMEAIEQRARVPITALAVNANLGAETTAEEIRAGRDFVSRLAEESGLPVAFEAGGEEALAPLPAVWPQLPIRRYLTPEWMKWHE